MVDDQPALPEGSETYTDFDAPLIDSRLDGDYLVRLAESVNDTVERFYLRSQDKRALDTEDLSDGKLDKELVYLAVEYVPEALEELGEAIDEARGIEEALEGQNTDRSHLDPEAEKEFMENYREAEGIYREVFQQLGRHVDGKPVHKFIDDSYNVNPVDAVGDLPEPRPDFQ